MRLCTVLGIVAAGKLCSHLTLAIEVGLQVCHLVMQHHDGIALVLDVGLGPYLESLY